jgi:hypothetical protein
MEAADEIGALDDDVAHRTIVLITQASRISYAAGEMTLSRFYGIDSDGDRR